jgi:hypothetical protein
LLSPEIGDQSEWIARHLRISPLPEGAEFRQLRIHYRQQRDIPIRVERWADPDMVQEEVDELLEFLVDADDLAVGPVRELLYGATEVVVFELRMSQVEDLGWPLAVAAAACLAELGDGLVQADGRGWMEPTATEVRRLLDEEAHV